MFTINMLLKMIDEYNRNKSAADTVETAQLRFLSEILKTPENIKYFIDKLLIPNLFETSDLFEASEITDVPKIPILNDNPLWDFLEKQLHKYFEIKGGHDYTYFIISMITSKLIRMHDVTSFENILEKLKNPECDNDFFWDFLEKQLHECYTILSGDDKTNDIIGSIKSSLRASG